MTLEGKLVYREVCESKVAWDTQLPKKLADKWHQWETNLPERLTIRRAIPVPQEEIGSVQLHDFGDTSGKGVGAALVRQKSSVSQGLITAKARLAKQGFTIPRLELVAAHMAVNLATNVRSAICDLPVSTIQCWLDSSVVLHWIKKGGEYKQFVENRVRKIQAHTGIEWRHVPTTENPADLASRGNQ